MNESAARAIPTCPPWMPRDGPGLEREDTCKPERRGRHRRGNMRFQPIPTLAALCLLACAAPTRADGASRTDATVAPATKADFEWKGEVASGGRVQVSTVNGDVRVEPATGNTIRVRGTKSGKDAARVTIEVDAK